MRRNATQTAPSTEAPKGAAAQSNGPGRILIVDDEANVRAMMGATLEHHHHHVHLASNGREALEMLQQDTFDVVLTDIVMEDGSGLALLEQIRAHYPHLPVIMVTAVHDISVAVAPFWLDRPPPSVEVELPLTEQLVSVAI